MSLLEVRGLIKQYGRRTVVNSVDLDVNAGEIVGLLGPNGAGKTTTFRMTAGMIAPKSGTVTFNRQDVTHTPMYQRARLGLGYLAQDSSVFRRLTVEQNLVAILELMTTRHGKPFRISTKQRRERVDELLEQFGLTRLRKSMASNLSGGERRRLEIARCLISEPMLIMLDEPFTGIDPKTVGDIQKIVEDLRDNGIGILITDHHVAETLRITDRSYLIADGKMLTHGTPMDIVNDPNARKVYLGEDFNTAAIIAPSDSRPAADAMITECIAQLATENAEEAANRLRILGDRSIRFLVDGLENENENVRRHCYDLLCDKAGPQPTFDPAADPTLRMQQVSIIRQQNSLRRAG